MPTIIFERLENTGVSWYCCTCGLPNTNTSLFKCLMQVHLPTLHRHAYHSPLIMTTPTSAHPDTNLPHHLTTYVLQQKNKKKDCVIVVNLQSITANREAFWAMLDYSAPDVILATETWHNPTITEQEVLPEGSAVAQW